MENTIKKNIQIIISISMFVKILGLLYRFLVARFLGIEGMTIFSLLAPILSLSICLSSLSIPGVINQRVSVNLAKDTYSNRPIIISALRITIISSSIIAIGLLLFSFPISHYIYKNDYLYYPIICTIPIIYFSNFSGILKGYYEAHNLFNITQASNLVEQIVKISICVILMILFHDINVIYLVILMVIGISISEVSSFTFLILKAKKITNLNIIKETNESKSLLKQAFPLTLSHLYGSLISFLEPIIFTYCLSKLSFSNELSQRYYTLIVGYALPILLMASFVTMGITKAIYPRLCKQMGDFPKTHDTIKKGLYLALYCSIFNLNVCTFYSKEILKLLYNNVESYKIVKNLSFGFFIFYFNPIFTITMQANNLGKNILINNIISNTLGIITMFICCLNPNINYNGFIISILVSHFLLVILNYLTIRTKIGFKFSIKAILLISILIIINLSLTSLIMNANKLMAFILPNFLSFLLLYLFNKNISTITKSQ